MEKHRGVTRAALGIARRAGRYPLRPPNTRPLRRSHLDRLGRSQTAPTGMDDHRVPEHPERTARRPLRGPRSRDLDAPNTVCRAAEQDASHHHATNRRPACRPPTAQPVALIVLQGHAHLTRFTTSPTQTPPRPTLPARTLPRSPPGPTMSRRWLPLPRASSAPPTPGTPSRTPCATATAGPWTKIATPTEKSAATPRHGPTSRPSSPTVSKSSPASARPRWRWIT